MTSRRVVLLAAAGGLAAAALPASFASADFFGGYDLETRNRITMSPAADASDYFLELHCCMRIFNMRDRQYYAQVNAKRTQNREGRDYDVAIGRLRTPRLIGLLRYLLAVLRAEGNSAARALDLVQVGVDYDTTAATEPILQAALADARVAASKNQSSHHQMRVLRLEEATNYVPEWLAAHRNGEPHTDYAPFVYFYLGAGSYESAVYATLTYRREDKGLKAIWNPNGEPVDPAEAARLSAETEAYLAGLPSVRENPLPVP